MIPFYSWMEINAPRYVRLMKNLKHEGDPNWTAARVVGVGTWKSTKLGLKIAGFAALVTLWNATFFEDEEDYIQSSNNFVYFLNCLYFRTGNLLS